MEIITVLVGTKYPQNIGSSARAVANMGGSQLVLVAPKCEINQQSYLSAAGAQAILDRSQVFNSWEEYLRFYPNSLRVAFSARDGKGRMAKMWDQLVSQFFTESDLNFTMTYHLIFGPEDCGLTDKDLLNCNFVSKLTTYGEFSSLNISQAVLLAMYILKSESQNEAVANVSLNNGQFSNMQAEDVYTLESELLKKWILAAGFSLNSPKVNAYTVLRKYFNRALLTHKEKQILDKVILQCLKK